MHPNVKKYKQYMEMQDNFTAKCKTFEKDFDSFIREVKQFQDIIYKWASENTAIVNELPVAENQHTSPLIAIMEKGTELSAAMSRLLEIEIKYFEAYTAFEVKLTAMLSNRDAGVVIAELPKIKDFCKRNHKLLNEMIAEIKKEVPKADVLYKELRAAYSKNLN